MSKLWDNRVRQHLGTRYDFRKGCFDWDLTMKLHEKGCCTINKQEYTQWRGSGLAFEMREGIYQVPNPSLLSFRVFSQGGNKVAARGYWGDIVSSPYLSFGIKTDDKSLLKTQNGQQVKTAQDVSYANVQMMFQSLLSRLKSSSTSPSEPKEPKAQTDLTINDLMHLTGVSVTFLPMAASGGQQGSIGLLLQLDAIPYLRCPPTSLGIVATTGTRYLTATASDSRIHNGRVDHGSLGLNVSNLSRDLVKALPEVGAEGLPTGDSARRSQQALTIRLGLPALSVSAEETESRNSGVKEELRSRLLEVCQLRKDIDELRESIFERKGH
ncbi:dynein assembly factor 3, axonemal-like [Cynoglossus semilaevis]|uniref:dynein assembly factor 3, axonemal-like n=1 Tax=Cynoglossus semilaevis TaxID=244447 RepID=UPI000D62C189|nr:dynein assembly factor 3, axonemal-like [Cynoglossus semilaevis]